MKKLIVILFGVASLGFGQAALAGEYAMSYSANELSNAAGVKSVHARIVKVAKKYCPTYSQIRNNKEVAACIADVVEDLVSKVDHPRLTGYHTGDESVQVASTGSSTGDRI